MDYEKVVGLTVAAIAIMALVYAAGYDFGKRAIMNDIHNYGCEKVLSVYNERK